jgi:hypothetical protein
MRPMYAIEITDAHQGRPQVCRNVFEFVEDLHGIEKRHYTAGFSRR